MSAPVLERELIPLHDPVDIVDNLPTGEYTDHYQPSYDDREAVIEAVDEVQATEKVTNPQQIERLQSQLTLLARGEISDPMAVTGRCAEEVELATPIEKLVGYAVRNVDIVRRGLGRVIQLHRSRGQSAKPRSAERENIDVAGVGVVKAESHYGDMVNSAVKTPQARRPDPTRMVSAVVQSRDLEAGMTEELGEHVPAAHEALLIPYEKASIFKDPETGKRYLLSADMPWIGKRTNDADGAHVEMLSGLENPIGIKIGADSDAGHIAALQQKLNPENVDGKLTFMIRVGLHEQAELRTIAAAIVAHAPNSLVMYDIHGVTRSRDGHKIRAVPEIIENVRMVAEALHEVDLTLHGVHLETIMDDDRLECVDAPDQLPTHPGGVDPQLNPRQLELVLKEIKEYLLIPTREGLRRMASELRGTNSYLERLRIRDMAGKDKYAAFSENDHTNAKLRSIASYQNERMSQYDNSTPGQAAANMM